ncbi:PilY1 Tfp pilus assembly protein, tip-associated adhesin PilY1 [Methylophilaceae bacterium]
MKRYLTLPALLSFLSYLLAPLSADAVDLASTPLGSASSSAAKPNILFILDDSFSMTYDYMPEWAGKAEICSGTDPICTAADLAFRSSDFNTLYYNPKFRYLPAKNANGTDRASMTSANTTAWTQVPNDAYGVITKAATSNLVGAAYYANMVAGEYCTEAHLRDCQVQNEPSTSHPYPAKVRFCNSLSRATSATAPPENGCQATVKAPYMTAFTRYPTRNGTVPGRLDRVDIVATTVSYPKTAGRTDCASSCSYAQEMTNYANWWAYYRTRLQTMKTSTSLAFAAIDDKYRVGYNVINNDQLDPDRESFSGSGANKFLNVATFNTSQKQKFYDRLFDAQPALNQTWQGNTYQDAFHYTPLRASLSQAGRYFAKKLSGQSVDPMQYACQANFTLLSTDGSWNKNSDFTTSQLDGDYVESGTFGPYRLNGTTAVGNQDASAGVAYPKREGSAFDNSLADVAMYYADTDLRSSGLGNCIGAEGLDVCGSATSKQSMTTFTVGLGINGTLIYTDDYKTATAGDFYDLSPVDSTHPPLLQWSDGCHSDYCPERVDDLWHAAVNGNGSYFSAQDPQQLLDSLSAALTEIYARANAGSAAATSTLKPVANNNSAYVASYTSMKWTGNLESRGIDTGTGQTSKTATWCVENVAADSCLDSLFNNVSNGINRTYCAPAGTTAFTPAMEIKGACLGKLPRQVASDEDERTIYTARNGALLGFTISNISTLVGSGLSQWSSLDSTQRSGMAEKLVRYVRGQSGYEDRGSNLAENRLFRYREKTLGDITDSSPVYVAAPNFNYLESGYSAFKAAQANRTKSVYVGANDGMLHAFNANDGTNIDNNGKERWAYIPSMLVNKLWKLADKNYSHAHQNYVNGSITVTDICSSPCSTASDWKTILVGGLGEGGQGFYALDINSNQPRLLWEFDNSDDADLGYSFGNPVIIKQSDGTWVVLLTSGYNNTGVGYLYVLNANTGALLRKISTQVGTAGNPSGLAKISAFVARPSENNQADYVYGGDLLGNLWRFKIDSAGSSSNPLLLASLKDSSGVAQAISARPELGKIRGYTVVFIGTGKYLGPSDLATAQSQTLYAIKDTGIHLNRANLSSRSISNTTSGSTRTGALQNEVFINGHGWYIDLPDSGERQVVAAKLASGTLIAPTMVPSRDACSPGGYGWINYINAKTGGIVTTTVAELIATKTSSPPVGINLLYIGSPKVSYTDSNDPTPQLDPNAPFNSGGGFAGKRASWRELIR